MIRMIFEDVNVDPIARIRELIEPAAQDLGYELVRITFGGDERAKLQIMAERADGQMLVEDCEKLSREVSAILDVADPIRSEYVLEVSSPGIDRPLTRRKDFVKYAGFDAKVTARHQIDGRRRFSGLLQGIDEKDMVLITTNEGPAQIPLDLVEKAKLILTDALLKAHANAAKVQEQ